MPQLDVSTFAPQLVWLAITFVVLYLLMAKLGLPRVSAILDARRKRQDDDLARAAEMKAEAEAALAAYQTTPRRRQRSGSALSGLPLRRRNGSGSSPRRLPSRQRQQNARLGQ